MELQDCRSQCYDNAAVMARDRSGVHQRLSKKNNLAMFVNCDNHSQLGGCTWSQAGCYDCHIFWNHRNSLRVLLSFNTALGKTKKRRACGHEVRVQNQVECKNKSSEANHQVP